MRHALLGLRGVADLPAADVRWAAVLDRLRACEMCHSARSLLRTLEARRSALKQLSTATAIRKNAMRAFSRLRTSASRHLHKTKEVQ
jgi:hypothetical protein